MVILLKDLCDVLYIIKEFFFFFDTNDYTVRAKVFYINKKQPLRGSVVEQ